MQLKVPPHSDEAEIAVIGGLLMDNLTWEQVDEILTADDFYRQEYRMIFAAIETLAMQFKPFDYVTVSDVLQARNELEVIGGESYIISIVERTLSAANIATYARLVRDKSILRKMINAGHLITDLGYQPQEQETQAVLEQAEQSIFNIAESYNKNNAEGFVTLKTVASETLKEIQRLSQCETTITGLPTGWKDYDEITSGLHNGELIIIAARPAMGKTTFALNMATSVAIKQRKNVAIFSLEMSYEQLGMRIMSSLSKVPFNRIRRGKLKDTDSQKMIGAVQQMSTAPLHIDDNFTLTPTELRSKCRRLVRQHGELGLIMVDYLQLMQVRGNDDNRVNQVSEISRSLKLLAKEFDCPVVALSQLNRSVEQRTNKRPVLSDLRDSGAIEQDADVITFIYRDAVYAGENEPERQQNRTAEIILGKQRNGETGTVKMTFLGETTQFVDYAYENDYVPFS
ncbi:MAG: replicative DNA helicase [Gammaproteobacteria bacterium]|nr:replicative DNA helicase [Gammaproteobacteria bacterium]